MGGEACIEIIADKQAVAFGGCAELLADRDVAAARPYSPRDTYAEGQVLDHPQFGRGFVSALRDAGKLDVTFRAGVKTLVHGRGER